MSVYNFFNLFFACAIRSRVGMLFTIVCLSLAGCGVRTVPVTSTTIETHSSDSISLKKESLKDSSSYKETVTAKTLPGGTVGVTQSLAGLDSLIRGLRAMPSTSRTIYYTDPKTKASLAFMLDRFDSLHITCTAMSQQYYEITRSSERMIASVKEESLTLKKENELLRHEIVELKKSFWERLKDGFNSWVVKILLIFIAFGLAVIAFDVLRAKLKSFISSRIKTD